MRVLGGCFAVSLLLAALASPAVAQDEEEKESAITATYLVTGLH